jgi:phytoene synthase
VAGSVGEKAVREAVRAHDFDRYLSALFVPRGAREGLMALYAFNADVARIPESVSEPMLGEIRLQWWRDALETLGQGGTTGNPVADALGAAIRTHGLPAETLLAIINARAFDLAGEPMPDMAALKAYLEHTQGNLFALAAQIVTGEEPNEKLQKLAAVAGFAWGLTSLLRNLPVHLSRGRLYLPVNHFRDYDADPGQLLRGVADDKAQKALLGLRDEAREAFGYTRAGVYGIARKQALAFLPCALVPLYLAELEKHGAEPPARVVDIGPLRRMRRLTWAALRGRL